MTSLPTELREWAGLVATHAPTSELREAAAELLKEGDIAVALDRFDQALRNGWYGHLIFKNDFTVPQWVRGWVNPEWKFLRVLSYHGKVACIQGLENNPYELEPA